MAGTILTFLIGILGGISVGIQSPMSGAIGKRVGGTAGSFIIHVSGAIFSGILLVSRGGENMKDWRTLPWYMLASGIFGLILYLTLSYTLPRLGALAAVSLIIVGQLLTGLVIDQFGLFDVAVRPVDLTRLLAVGLLLVGGYLMIK